MIVDKHIDFFLANRVDGAVVGSQIKPVGRPGPHKAAKSTQQGCQEQAVRAIRGRMTRQVARLVAQQTARVPGWQLVEQFRYYLIWIWTGSIGHNERFPAGALSPGPPACQPSPALRENWQADGRGRFRGDGGGCGTIFTPNRLLVKYSTSCLCDVNF